MIKALSISILFLLFLQNANAQPSITGTWEGQMGNEMLQVNVLAKNNKICGYTYDYFINNKREYCKALFEAKYNKDQEVWYLNGTGFLENSGGHVLMRLRLWFEPGEGKNSMHALVATKSGLLSLLSSAEEVILKKVSPVPNNLQAIEAACFPPEVKPKVERKKTTPPPAPTPVPTKPKEPVKDSITVSRALPVPPPLPRIEIKKDSVHKNITARKKNTFAHLVVDVKNITLNVYDNGIVDGDTVSIYYNGKQIASRQRISEKALTLQIELDESVSVHEITLFAENLGSIPPNTALVVVLAGGKRYELHSSASLTENAVLYLEYKPK